MELTPLLFNIIICHATKAYLLTYTPHRL